VINLIAFSFVGALVLRAQLLATDPFWIEGQLEVILSFDSRSLVSVYTVIFFAS